MTGAVPSVPALVPAPRRLALLAGSVTWSDGLQIEAPEELAAVARWFRRVVEQGSKWRVALVPVGSSSSQLRLALDPEAPGSGTVELAGGSEEGYRVRVADGAVTVAGPSPAGVFHGLQTLRQLLPDSWWRLAPREPAPPVELAGMEIVDEPAFSWRGVHLDVSRHFMPKGFVLKLIDLISMHKCNVLHLHLTDDQGWRIPVEAYPRLIEVGAWRRESPVDEHPERGDGKPHGGFYSTEDLGEIVAYAAERFVHVLPEIDMPGHMVAAIASYPELGNSREPREVLTTWGISPHVLNLEEATLKFCTDVLDAVIDVFPWEYVHVGGDECPTT
ncbi:MAG TPA: beta-N-acetylhexosaminidase, partial [Acidimicrobiales bacterium]|nr:beta-N-acetylhexosaminidase [Acidimicrobiales bacterium]